MCRTRPAIQRAEQEYASGADADAAQQHATAIAILGDSWFHRLPLPRTVPGRASAYVAPTPTNTAARSIDNDYRMHAAYHARAGASTAALISRVLPYAHRSLIRQFATLDKVPPGRYSWA